MRLEAEPGSELSEVWAYLTPDEAHELLDALHFWANEEPRDPEWHAHIGGPGSELTIAVEESG